jgi:hypothetical protein
MPSCEVATGRATRAGRSVCHEEKLDRALVEGFHTLLGEHSVRDGSIDAVGPEISNLSELLPDPTLEPTRQQPEPHAQRTLPSGVAIALLEP